MRTTFSRTYPRNFSAALALGFLFSVTSFVACSSEETGSNTEDVTDCTGAKLDQGGKCRLANGRFAASSCCAAVQPLEASCEVVFVDYDLSEFEEGLGSMYELSAEGYLEVDEDATSLDIEIGASGSQVWIGHHLFESEDGDEIEVVEEEVESWAPARETVRVSPNGWEESYLIRRFPESGLGIVLVEKDGSIQGQLATLDCRGVLANTTAAGLDPEDLSCDVAWVDYDVSDFDEGLVHVYDTDYEGLSQGDEGYSSVYVDREASGWNIYIGGFGFDEADGDVISQTIPSGADIPVVHYDIQPAGDDDTYRVSFFPESGMGIVLQGAAGEPASTHLAAIDCRDLPRHTVYDL